jgi:hypothetical protein
VKYVRNKRLVQVGIEIHIVEKHIEKTSNAVKIDMTIFR